MDSKFSKFKPHASQMAGGSAPVSARAPEPAPRATSTAPASPRPASIGSTSVRYEGLTETRVEEYQMNRIEIPGRGTYQDLKQRYGALAATDEDRIPKSRKDSRFMLSPMMRDHLSIEEEEKRAIRAQIQNELEQLREQAKLDGRQEGYQAGLQQGRQEALTKFSFEGAQAIERIENVVNQIEGARAQILRDQERSLMDLVAHVGQMLAVEQLRADPNYLSRLTKQLVEQIGVRENFKIWLSAADAALIGQIRGDLVTRFGELKNLTVETSPSVKQGGCIIETAWNCIDASVEKQFAQIRSALQGVEVAPVIAPVGASDDPASDGGKSGPASL